MPRLRLELVTNLIGIIAISFQAVPTLRRREVCPFNFGGCRNSSLVRSHIGYLGIDIDL